MRVVVIGDVGVLDDTVHIGDEAMFEEFVTQLRARGFDEVTGISSNPAETAARYGIDSVARVGFAAALTPDGSARDERMARVLRAAASVASGAGAAAGRGAGGVAGVAGDTAVSADSASADLAADDPAHAVIAAVRSADGVAVSGGGNLSSIWAEHIYERATLAALAELFGKPFVVSGQTIGPVLTGSDVDLTAQLLASAALVGLREPSSVEIVTSLAERFPIDLGRVRATIDDASFLGLGAAPRDPLPDGAPEASALASRAPYCLVTFAAHVGGSDKAAYVTAAAALLDTVVDETGLDVVFLAHFGALDAGRSVGDTVMHEAIAAQTTSGRVFTAPSTDAVAAAALARGAALVVTSRYHPAVFAVSTGVPTIGIPVDGYTSNKLRGALGNGGQSGILPGSDLVAGGGAAIVRRVWSEREAIRTKGQASLPARLAASTRWWDDVATALGATSAGSIGPRSLRNDADNA